MPENHDHQSGHWRHQRGWGPGARPPLLRRLVGLVLALVMIGLLVGVAFAVIVGLIPGPQRWLVAGVTVLILVGAGITLRRTFGKSFAPVGSLIDGIQRVGEGEKGVRVPINSPGPFAAVSNSFNRMAADLDEQDERRRRLLADLSHELRTPLTVVRGEIEAVIDGVHPPDSLSNVIDEVVLMERLLEDLRVLALAEAGRLPLHREQTELMTLVEDVIASFAAPIEAQGLVVIVDKQPAQVEISLDPHRIRQVLSNLISNAIRQMPDGGELEVVANADSRRVLITISDTGPGIPEDALVAIFDRFVKSGDSKGSGLGLSIARDLVVAHRGTLTATNRLEGGATFAVLLPLADD